MANQLDIFRKEYLQANSWAQRKDGVPLYLLDRLSAEERKIAESELIKAIDPGDTWPVIGLGHIKSRDALPALYKLLSKTEGHIKVTIAHAIFQICQDAKMIDLVLKEVPGIHNWTQLIDILYLLPDFKDESINSMLHQYRNHEDYLVAYNATRALGLPTEEVVENFRKKRAEGKVMPPQLPKEKPEKKWWEKIFNG